MAVDIFNNETRPWIFSISYGWPEVLFLFNFPALQLIPWRFWLAEALSFKPTAEAETTLNTSPVPMLSWLNSEPWESLSSPALKTKVHPLRPTCTAPTTPTLSSESTLDLPPTLPLSLELLLSPTRTRELARSPPYHFDHWILFRFFDTWRFATETHAPTAPPSNLACKTTLLTNGPLVVVSVKSLLPLRITLEIAKIFISLTP